MFAEMEVLLRWVLRDVPCLCYMCAFQQLVTTGIHLVMGGAGLLIFYLIMVVREHWLMLLRV